MSDSTYGVTTRQSRLVSMRSASGTTRVQAARSSTILCASDASQASSDLSQASPAAHTASVAGAFPTEASSTVDGSPSAVDSSSSLISLPTFEAPAAVGATDAPDTSSVSQLPSRRTKDCSAAECAQSVNRALWSLPLSATCTRQSVEHADQVAGQHEYQADLADRIVGHVDDHTGHIDESVGHVDQLDGQRSTGETVPNLQNWSVTLGGVTVTTLPGVPRVGVAVDVVGIQPGRRRRATASVLLTYHEARLLAGALMHQVALLEEDGLTTPLAGPPMQSATASVTVGHQEVAFSSPASMLRPALTVSPMPTGSSAPTVSSLFAVPSMTVIPAGATASETATLPSSLPDRQEHPAWCVWSHEACPCVYHSAEGVNVPATAGQFTPHDEGAIFPRLEIYAIWHAPTGLAGIAISVTSPDTWVETQLSVTHAHALVQVLTEQILPAQTVL